MHLRDCAGCGKLRRFMQSSKTHRVEDYCMYGGGLIPLAKVEKCPREDKV